jgi:hypothetical protein
VRGGQHSTVSSLDPEGPAASRNFFSGSKNIAHTSLVAVPKVVLPPLQMKLGVMKQFVRALNAEGGCSEHMCHKFTTLTGTTLKDGLFTGPYVRKILSDPTFEGTVSAAEQTAWQASRDVVTKFRGNTKDPNYTNIVNKMLDAFKDLGCNVTLKLHFLHSHLDYFAENLGSFSEGQGEGLHTDVKETERRYQGRWNINTLADCRWNLTQEVPESACRRKEPRGTFTKRQQSLQWP